MVRNVLELFLNILLWLFVCISLTWLPWVSFWILTEEHLVWDFTGSRKNKKVILRHLYSSLIGTALCLNRLRNTGFKLCCDLLAWEPVLTADASHINLVLVKTNEKEWTCSHAVWGHRRLWVRIISPLLASSCSAASGHTADKELNMKLTKRATFEVA